MLRQVQAGQAARLQAEGEGQAPSGGGAQGRQRSAELRCCCPKKARPDHLKYEANSDSSARLRPFSTLKRKQADRTLELAGEATEDGLERMQRRKSPAVAREPMPLGIELAGLRSGDRHAAAELFWIAASCSAFGSAPSRAGAMLRAAGAILRRLPGLLQHIVRVVVTVSSKNAVQTAFLCTNVVVLSISERRRLRANNPLTLRLLHSA